MKKILSYLLIAGASYAGYSQCTTPIPAPWLEEFEFTTFNFGAASTAQNCWYATGSGPFWRTDNLNTGSSDTGPAAAYGGSRYAYLETSTGAGTDNLWSPEIDLTTIVDPSLNFYYHMFGSINGVSEMGTLSVEIVANGVATQVWSLAGEQQTSMTDPWEYAIINLSAYTNDTIQVKFVGLRGVSFRSDMSIDNVSICSPTYSTISATSCGYYTAPSGAQLHGAGTYTDTIPNYVGCDSIITINLATSNTSSSLTINNICGNYTMPSGQVVGQDGAYTDTTMNAAGCDSVIFYNLTFNNSFSLFSTDACNVYTAPSGAQYTLSGTYTDTITNAVGCDSVMTINLTMYFDNSLTIFVSTCGDPYTSDAGNVYTVTGVYQEDFQSANGCDSIVFIDLTIAEGNETFLTIDACDEWTSDAGILYDASGVYQEVYTGATGCDSTLNYTVNINTVDNSANWVSAMTIEANETGATYQWVDCNNSNATIPGATTKIFVASVNGDYACMVTKNGCTEMTNCVRVGSLGVDENMNLFSIYPNPSSGVFAIEMPEVVANTNVTITNAAGQIVFSSSLNESILNVDLGDVEAGMYFISVSNENGAAKKAIVIQ
ncbi:MAG: T9SS type A sorting domain-containing protein [Crocinitomicaceae bacterium]